MTDETSASPESSAQPPAANEPPAAASVAAAAAAVDAPAPLAQPPAAPAAGDGVTGTYTGPLATGSAPSIGSTPSAGSAPRTLTPVPLAWQSWPVVDSVWELLSLSAIVVLVPLVVWLSSGHAAATIACGLATALAVSRSFVPTVYELNALGVTSRTLRRSRRIPWISIDRFVVGRRGVFLTSAGAPLEIFRGLYLPWGEHREQILRSLRYYLPHAEDRPAS